MVVLYYSKLCFVKWDNYDPRWLLFIYNYDLLGGSYLRMIAAFSYVFAVIGYGYWSDLLSLNVRKVFIMKVRMV